jgi:hypothetical protein
LNKIKCLRGSAAAAAEPPQRTAALSNINGLERSGANRRKPPQLRKIKGLGFRHFHTSENLRWFWRHH